MDRLAEMAAPNLPANADRVAGQAIADGLSFEAMQRLIAGAAMSQAIAAAAELGIADLLEQGARTLPDLAVAAGCDTDALHRLLRALAGIGWCKIGDDGTVTLCAGGASFTGGSEVLLRDYALWWGQHRWPAWGNLAYCVRTGQRAAGTLSGKAGMKDLESGTEAARVFHGAMAGVTRIVARSLLATCDLSDVQGIVDVGGGYGESLAILLSAHPALRGVLFDLPHALDGARRHLDDAGVGTRCEVVGGNFFEAVPAGADLYLLKAILHDWSDEESVTILNRCRAACATGTRLLLVEQVLPERIEACVAHQRAALADLNMLVMLGGRERTAAEFGTLLARAGFALDSIRDAALGYSVVEARAQ